MRGLIILLAVLPLTLATLICECPRPNCPTEDPAKCKCENRAAVLCAAKCGGKPSQTKCPTPTTSTTPSTTSATSSPTPTLCGSRSMPPCDAPYTCIADPNNLGCSLIADCPGLCMRLDGQTCGGFANLQCPADQTCVEDPRDSCDPNAGGADCSGVCVYLDGRSAAPTKRAAPTPEACGGFAGIPCPAGKKCIDKPGDGCDPKKGGADCIGICV